MLGIYGRPNTNRRFPINLPGEFGTGKKQYRVKPVRVKPVPGYRHP